MNGIHKDVAAPRFVDDLVELKSARRVLAVGQHDNDLAIEIGTIPGRPLLIANRDKNRLV